MPDEEELVTQEQTIAEEVEVQTIPASFCDSLDIQSLTLEGSRPASMKPQSNNSPVSVFQSNPPHSNDMMTDPQNRILCLCQVNEVTNFKSQTDLGMIQCNKCSYWMHTVCCGFMSNQDTRMPVIYECINCQYSQNSKVIEFATELARYRRIVSILFTEKLDSLKAIASRCGYSLNLTKKLLIRMKEEKLAIQKSKRWAPILDANSREHLNHLFQPQIECQLGFKLLTEVASGQVGEHSSQASDVLFPWDPIPRKRRKVSVVAEPIFFSKK